MRILLRAHLWDGARQVWLAPGEIIEIAESDLPRYRYHGDPVQDTADEPAPSTKPAGAARKK